MEPEIDTTHIHNVGWVRIASAVPAALCERLVSVLENELGVPIHEPGRWDEYGSVSRDLIPIWGHQAQWDIRQHPNLHRFWATLWETERLWVSLDSCRFTPPWRLVMTNPTPSTGTTIRGTRLGGCFKACLH
jgi:hypothetical protein